MEIVTEEFLEVGQIDILGHCHAGNACVLIDIDFAERHTRAD
jgi:hypothetical protein